MLCSPKWTKGTQKNLKKALQHFQSNYLSNGLEVNLSDSLSRKSALLF